MFERLVRLIKYVTPFDMLDSIILDESFFIHIYIWDICVTDGMNTTMARFNIR